jgi:SAM-dependent methyltransferase
MDYLDTKTIARQLFRVSPLKQRKMRMLEAQMDDPQGKVSLDLGSDNGVISLLLRDRGGVWHSADLIPETVEAIRDLVGDRVDRVDGARLPYHDQQFDQVLVVDLLEHVLDDALLVQEIARVLKPSGTVVLNVPNPKEGIVRKIRYMLGQTDAAHGHLRAGYTEEALRSLLGENFQVERVVSYSRVFSNVVDAIIVGALSILKSGSRGKKGTVVSARDLAKQKKSFALFTLIAPLLRCCVALDACVPWMHGDMLILRAKRCSSKG